MVSRCWVVRAAVAVLFGFLLTRPALASFQSPFSLVAQAIAAKHTLSFTARQSIFLSPAASATKSQAGKAVQIVADVLQSGHEVRMTYLRPAAAARRVVVDNGRQVRQWEPAQQVILVNESHQETAAARHRMLALLHRNYRCLRLRQARVNGLTCDVIAVRPRPGHTGPTRLLWIERGRRAILRTEEFDTAGIRRYLSFYQAFHYTAPLPARRFALPSGMRVCTVGPSERDESSFHAAFAAARLAGRLPAWLPEGYTLISSAVAQGPEGHCGALLHYGDGLKMLSVFETRENAPASGLSHSTPPVGMQVWQYNIGFLHLAVVGDNTLPVAVGEEMLAALKPQSAAALRHGLAAHFGRAALPLASRLRRQGWGYDHIAAICLSLKARHQREGTAWDGLLPTPSVWQEHQARLWVTSIIDHH